MNRQHSHMWNHLTPEVQDAIERQLAKTRPLSEWPEDKVRRLAAHLGLANNNAGGGDRAA